MRKVPSLPETGTVERALKGGMLLRLRRFVDDRRGVGAIEFAIVAPLLIMAYVGAFEVSVAITALRKVSRASSSTLSGNARAAEASISVSSLTGRNVPCPARASP